MFSSCFCFSVFVGIICVWVIFVNCLLKLSVYLPVYLGTDYVSGGEMFTHLYQRDHFPEEAVRIYIGEIILALEHLHKVGVYPSSSVILSYINRSE